MASSQDSFSIDVNINGATSSPTSPTRKSSGAGRNPLSVSGFLKNAGIKNAASYAMVAAAAVSLGKTYIDLQFSKSENSNQAKRFGFALKIAGYAGTIAGASTLGGPIGTVASSAYVAANITGDVLTYNTDLQKKQIRFDYTNEKYKQNTADGSRFRGGSL